VSAQESREYRVIGPPGTGKTTYLAGVLQRCATHYGPDRVLALSHTRAAAAELAGRDLPLPRSAVGTVHSACYHALDRPELAEVSTAKLAAFAEWSGYRMAGTATVDDPYSASPMDDEGGRLLAETVRLRNKLVPREEWPSDAFDFDAKWEEWKSAEGLADFTDLLEWALRDVHVAPGNPDALVVDECQDSTALQMALIWQWAEYPERVVFALDPDQSIYGFAGADPRVFMTRPAARQEVLAQSHRVPRAVHAAAVAWIQQARHREQFAYLPRDEEGRVAHHPATWRTPERLLPDLLDEVGAGRSVIVQATCAYMLTPLLAVLRREGVPFGHPWRRSRGDWNPLARGRRGEVSSVDAVLALLAPHLRERGLWTAEEARRWTHVVKGLFRRGGRDRFAALLDEGWGAPEALIETVREERDLDLASAAPPGCLDWLEEHVRSERARVVGFAAHVAWVRGMEALQEEPRLHVGTVHSFKGAEADVVFVLPDLSVAAYREAGSEEGHDALVRLFYVALTRARETVWLCDACEAAHVRWLV